MAGPFKMYGKSPMMKKLIGKQHNLPEELKAKIEASPVRQDKKKSYTTKDPEKSISKKGEGEFGLYKAGIGAKWHEHGYPGAKYSEKDREAAHGAEMGTAAGLAGTISLGGTIGAGGAALGAGLTGAGIVLGEGIRRIKAGKTNFKERPASKFSGGKTWSEAKKEGKSDIWKKKK